MRRIKRAPLAIFNLSFLDVISCAFGAVVMLVLLSKNADELAEQEPDNLSPLLQSLISARSQIQQLQSSVDEKQSEYDKVRQASLSASQSQRDTESSIPRAQQTLQQLEDQARSLRAQLNQANARLRAAQKLTEPDEEVGGIPTDAEYVIFVIDNSGSMAGGSG